MLTFQLYQLSTEDSQQHSTKTSIHLSKHTRDFSFCVIGKRHVSGICWANFNLYNDSPFLTWLLNIMGQSQTPLGWVCSLHEPPGSRCRCGWDPVHAVIVLFMTVITIVWRLWVELGGSRLNLLQRTTGCRCTGAWISTPQSSAESLLTDISLRYHNCGIIIGLLAGVSNVFVFGTGIGLLLFGWYIIRITITCWSESK